MPMKYDYKVKSIVSESGNSDVDVNVVVDTTALAYAFATFMYIDGRLPKNKYDEMVAELDKYTGRNTNDTGNIASLINQTKNSLNKL
ncbi:MULTISPECIES: hypothetical protein [Bacillaceae]|uniref:Uncharacterized protein n=1 Tax=Evansella alkalicola TaxID=745819 RepID=A0ABS6JV64_9BACI|nr:MULTISPECIES: hypothetical protein [Bacillaceae]MBU9722465.1 hypothetical protein [Bacillus alkalicola]